MSRHSDFRDRLRRREPLLGTFAKTPSSIVCEILGGAPLDCVCIDAEHAPFDRVEIDRCIHALRARDLPSLVRVPGGGPEHLLGALDSGATGVVVPHVKSARHAVDIVRSARYGPGGRGYAGSTRAADFGAKAMSAHLSDSAATTTVVAQIEDIEALEDIDAIASVDGIDCLFVGRIDLTVSYGASSPDDSRVVAAVEAICRAGRTAGRCVGMYVSQVSEVRGWLDLGASFFLLESDQAFLQRGARDLRARFEAARG